MAINVADKWFKSKELNEEEKRWGFISLALTRGQPEAIVYVHEHRM